MKLSERTKTELVCGVAMIVFMAIVIGLHSLVHTDDAEQSETVTQAYEVVTDESDMAV